MPNYASSPQRNSRRRDLVAAVIRSGLPAYELAGTGRRPPQQEQFIQREIERILYEPKLPHGGAAERRTVDRLRALGRRREWGGHFRARAAAEKWAAINGWYYKRRPLLPKRDAQEYEWHTAMRQSAITHNQPEYRWFAELMLGGLPEPVADFKMECRLLVQKPDGKTVRLVQLRNVVGEMSKIVELPAVGFAQPGHFREWLLKCGTFTWKAGEKELQDLHEDLNRASAWRTVQQVMACGWHAISGTIPQPQEGGGPSLQNGIWFMGDSAFAPDGAELTPDREGVYRWDNVAYCSAKKGARANFFKANPSCAPDSIG